MEDDQKGCLITASYDGCLRIWRDLDSSQVSMAQVTNLFRHSDYPPPSIDLVIVSRKDGQQKVGLVAIAGKHSSTPCIHMCQIPRDDKHNEVHHIYLQQIQRPSRDWKPSNVSCVKISGDEARIFATTDQGRVFMVTMDTIDINKGGTTKDGTERHIGADAGCDIPPRHNKEKTMGSLEFGATSCTIFRDSECFVSDIHGQIHFWSPNKSSDALKCVFQNDTERPIQSIACDPLSDYLIATDWNGIIYFWHIKSEEKEWPTGSCGSTLVELIKPHEWKIEKPAVPGYGLRCVWCGDGTRFAVTQSSGLVYLYQMCPDTRLPFLMDTIKAGDTTAWVWDCSWDCTGKMLITANSAGLIKLWEENQLEKALSESEKLEKSDKPKSDEKLKSSGKSGLKWKSLNHKEINLREHMSQNEHSTVISSLLYREIPAEIFTTMKQQGPGYFLN